MCAAGVVPLHLARDQVGPRGALGSVTLPLAPRAIGLQDRVVELRTDQGPHLTRRRRHARRSSRRAWDEPTLRLAQEARLAQPPEVRRHA